MHRRRQLFALGAPGLIWTALFVTVGLYSLIAIAVGGLNPILLTPVPIWNPLHWNFAVLGQVTSSFNPFGGQDWHLFLRTCIYIAISLTACIVIGYPVAYFTAVRAKRTKGPLLVLLIVPLLVSYMLRMLAWVGLLSPGGWVNATLMHLGIISAQINWLNGMSVTVVLGLIYGWIPYFILPVYASLARFDTRYLEAASDLGAGGAQTFLRVTLPLSTQGILAGSVIVALPMFGDYFTNGLLSGTGSTSMVGTLINSYAQSESGQGTAAAQALLLIAFLTLLLLPYLRSAARANALVVR
jgi:spermidine/putrescine transport system permease protein